MSRRDNAEFRCAQCRMLGGLCLCATLPRLETRTRLVLVLHRIEARKPTNTGRLAALCLPNSAIVVRGHEGQPTAPIVPAEGTRPLLLFPHEGAVPLDARFRADGPFTLIVPDGTWRQASKVRQRVPGLAEVPCVTLPRGAPSLYRLRAEAHETGLATAEAIARAFGILEGAHVQEALEAVFRAMVERALWSRGIVPASEVSGGIPEGVGRHHREAMFGRAAPGDAPRSEDGGDDGLAARGR